MLDIIAEVVTAVDRTDNPEHGSVEYTESRPALYTKIQDQPHSLLAPFKLTNIRQTFYRWKGNG